MGCGYHPHHRVCSDPVWDELVAGDAAAAQLGVISVTSVEFLSEVFNWNLIMRR